MNDPNWHSKQCAEQIVAQCEVDALRERVKMLKKHSSNYLKGKQEATQRITQEIENLQSQISNLEAKGYDRWQDRLDDWYSDYDAY